MRQTKLLELRTSKNELFVQKAQQKYACLDFSLSASTRKELRLAHSVAENNAMAHDSKTPGIRYVSP
jgi:hypothetical protein